MQVQPPAFGDQLRRYRTRAGLTQEALAERVGLASTTISALERGVRRRPYPHTRERLSAALGLSEEERAGFVASREARLTTATVVPTNIQPQRTSLIGRERDVESLRTVVRQGEARLVTLTGVGGCGKTRLALRVAADLRDSFPAGAWLVELAPLADPRQVVQAMAAAIGVIEIPEVALIDALRDVLRRRPPLLVLDNCEHLIDACAELVEQLLSACPDLRILATSREPFQIAGEQQWRVPPLATPEFADTASLAEIAGYSAVQLFVARAQAVAPSFRLSEENATDVARICTRLGGLPLAVELAAVRVRVMAVSQILARLDDAIRLLTGGSRAAPTRQQTLRAALDWSYDLLTPPEKDVFARLAVFAGGCDLEAAEAVCSGEAVLAEDVLDLLTHLVDKSLILAEENATASRYRLLEPVRQYALKHLLADPQSTTVYERHSAHFLALSERTVPELHGPRQMVWFDRFERERDNFRTALQRTVEAGAVEPGLRLALALAPFWEGRNYLSEGRQWFETLLSLTSASAVSPTLRARALLASGRLAQWQAQLEDATTLLEACLALARPLDDRLVIAEALVYLGAVRRRQRSLTESASLLEESLALYQAADDSAGIALALLTLGVTVRFQGDTTRSVSLLEESLDRFRQAGDFRWVAITLGMLGTPLLDQGNVARAESCILEGLALQYAVGDRAFSIFSLMDLAKLYAVQAQPVRSARVLGAMLALSEVVGVPLTLVDQMDTEHIAASARVQLSATDFERAFAAGRGLTLDEVLAEGSEPLRQIPPSSGYASDLKHRSSNRIGAPGSALFRHQNGG